LQFPYAAFNPQDLLDVMPNFMRQHIGLGKLPRGAESTFQLLVESEVDINLFVFGAIKGARRRLGCTTPGRSPLISRPLVKSSCYYRSDSLILTFAVRSRQADSAVLRIWYFLHSPAAQFKIQQIIQ
jgi:hypothetical protein